MSRFAWPAAALAAIAFLAALALTGGRGGPGLAPFTPSGLLVMSTAEVREVDVAAPAGQWRFAREGEGWRVAQGNAPPGFNARLEAALTLLRNSGPERMLSEDEVASVDAAQFGLDPPKLRVVVRGAEGKTFAISFGATSLLGLSHYARIDGRREVALLPGFVAEAWEQVGGAQ
ncbi:hypothetical protein IVA87_01450 [Bradyrhizobium sp. 147]|uniref:DUF4340 domain-containing protein n=1 Tax=unclassified Bradyrhizobium TaxID=2631580 RepID=UPI001FF7F3BD|nr:MULTISPECIES: DUF4340 domain-containing protein [unclassified Bradyrhizobium]MCK1546265.1 hypothetical protein [Bradyrhizobium sp. 179]MCK1625379.1 hypothetical protein [Bradyrhizobium sp. 160]MCK1678172.1 hypothetical protein [Bradyrhizobium sp. 147]